MDESIRKENDTLGSVDIPKDAYYGAQTQRAVLNFPISGNRADTDFIKATAIIKKASALTNMKLSKLKKKIGKVIVKASDEVIAGKFNDQFVVDVFQAGAGTSHNMNANEVIANRAIELLGKHKGAYSYVHPNDHVNMSQSTNDVFPTAMRISAIIKLQGLFSVLDELEADLIKKAKEFKKVIKAGRTHMQDAAPVTLGQEFSAYAESVKRAKKRIKNSSASLYELGIGATAVGTGLNTHKDYKKNVVKYLSDLLGYPFKISSNLFYSTQSMSDFCDLSSSLKSLSVELIKIANDLRLLSSGPTTGFFEIVLPSVQPGSSIMPGKVNPVMAEVLNMVCFQVIGNDLAVTMAAQAGQLELNVMMPVINVNVLSSINILRNTICSFTGKCIKGIVANKELCEKYSEKTLGLATILNQHIGYEQAANVVYESLKTGRPIKEIVLKKGLLTSKKIKEIFDPIKMT